MKYPQRLTTFPLVTCVTVPGSLILLSVFSQIRLAALWATDPLFPL